MEFKSWFKEENHDLYNNPKSAMEEAWNAAIESTKVWRPMSEAPRDGTPVLLKFKYSVPEFLSIKPWVSVVFVGKNNGDPQDWRFAAPVGQGGIPDERLEGWREI